jgi:6-phosphogluconolactonase/glucosamine-6-phosphate isomerase/deaminase
MRTLFAASAVAAATLLTMSTSALAKCRDVTVSAQGAEKQNVDDATSAAGDALVRKIAATHGPTWSVGSHRNGSFRCDKVLGGRKPGWTCTATTAVICAP